MYVLRAQSMAKVVGAKTEEVSRWSNAICVYLARIVARVSVGVGVKLSDKRASAHRCVTMWMPGCVDEYAEQQSSYHDGNAYNIPACLVCSCSHDYRRTRGLGFLLSTHTQAV